MRLLQPRRQLLLSPDVRELLALAHHDVGFSLASAGRTVLQCPPAGSLAERFYQLFGERPDLVEVNKEAAGVRIFGYVAALAGDQGPTRGAQNVFVNSRSVRDRTVAHAIIDAYSGSSVKERSPEVHLFIEMPPDRVDVNVHPAKAEVRFREQSLVHELVRRAIGSALGAAPIPELQLSSPMQVVAQPVVQSLPRVFTIAPPSATRVGLAGTAAAPGAPVKAGGPAEVSAGGAASGTAEAAAEQIGRMTPLGQFRDTYIIAADEEGLAIIDQHVAHERVLFERVLQRLSVGRLESQRFLEPLILRFPASARDVLVAHAEELERFGFEIEEFGGDSLRIVAAPALLGADECGAALGALASDLEGLDKGSRVEEALRRIAARTACHAAVKANDRLTVEKMVHILDELRQTAYSTVCPHGRPVMLRLTRREIERNFRRI